MPTLKEIKGRIGSVKSTLKITSAMKLVSSAKLRKAQNAIAAMRPYEEELRRMLEMASGAGGVTETVTSPAKTADFAGDVPENVTSPAVIIAVASNSSLCGGFNANVIAKVRAVRRSGDVVYSIGRKMADAMARDGFSSPSDYSALSEHPAYADAAALVEKLAGDFYEGRISGVTLVYTHFVSTAKQVPVVEPLLHAAGRDGISSASLRDPIRANAPEMPSLPAEDPSRPILEPSARELLAALLPRTLKLKLYAALLDSAAAEHAARTIAMQTATDNAEDLLAELTLQYNKGRQQKITSEILDLAGGQAAE
ncbi:MAG: ATP synthase F1 subunit gamma [Bacteroidales bacterium]|nr:ATP synthase F1 subunit gamma [Bacteroidales bacterium]